ncbi:MAG: RNA polymerase sigma factor [Prevotella sp.]|nr:RNA polymerase sigma factor [Prevotella sp.]MBQ6210129.1 RNA polymerase sigma factor [Prevotella sp.]
MESQDFQHIVTTIRPKLVNLCQSFFDRQELAYDAEDAVQETLMRMWQMRERIGGYQKPEALAMLIAKNVCIDILKLCKEQHEPLDETANVISNEQADQTIITHDMERLINNALAKVPTAQRRMLMMRSEGMSMTEIAAVCGATPTSTKTMVCAARKRMMELLMIRRNKK